jgi:DNA-binding NtrC family response regulator
MDKAKILIVDDDKFFCEIKSTLLTKNGYKVDYINSADIAIEKLQNEQFDLVLLDLNLGKAFGIDVLQDIKRIDPDMVVIMVTAMSDIQIAVDAIKKGAYDYLSKDIPDEELLIKIGRALEKHKNILEIHNLKSALTEKFSFSNIVGQNDKMKQIYTLIKNICTTDVTVLVVGETGTGKELIAKAIHFNSHRKDKPFIAINCAAISEHLMESELFGHEKGAFTDAYKQKIGKVEVANEGTLFLDEIGDMSFGLQAKLLRFLQDKQFERVGGTAKLSSDVRIIAATNKNLLKAIEEGKFREDLYYRLNVIRIEVPSLREREDDLTLLAEHFVKQSCIKFKKNIKTISPESLKKLQEYQWPGNIRELENLIDNLVLTTSSDIINVEDIPKQFSIVKDAQFKEQTINTEITLRDARNEFEKNYLTELLKKHNGNINIISEKSGMNRKSIFLKLQEYNLNKDDYKK